MAASDFDLDAYLARIGLDAPPPADAEGLAAVQFAQLCAIPFENLDVVVHGAVDVDPAAVFDKLVFRRRGGYCFECNTLLRDALRAMGFEARSLLGRVVLNRVDGPVPARTHACVEVDLDGTLYMADAGFGGRTARAPLPLANAAEAGGCRLQADPTFSWRLFGLSPDKPPVDLYVFDQGRVFPSDIAIGNHWTSSHPTSHFTQRPLAVRHTDDGRITLDGSRLAEYTADASRIHIVEEADELLHVIRDRLDIPLEVTSEQLASLWNKARAWAIE